MSQAVNLTPQNSEEIIYSQLIQAGFPDQFAKLVTAQSGHESDGWTSNVYMRNNNPFGYGYTGSDYQYYNSVEDSVNGDKGIVAYINRRLKSGQFPPLDQITGPDQYAGLLKDAGYYTDSQSNYASGIARWFNDNLKTLALSSGLIIFGLLMLYLLLRK